MVSAVLVALWIICSAGVTGRAISRFLDLRSSNARTSLELLLGFGTLGTVLFFVGLWQWRPIPVALVLAVPLLYCLRRPRKLFSFANNWHYHLTKTAARVGRFDILNAALLLPICISALALPMGSPGDDAISYHLFGPKMWEHNHHIAPTLSMSHTAFPAVVETLYGAGRLLANDRVAGLLGIAFLICLLLQVRALASFFGASHEIAKLAVTLAISTPVLVFTAEKAFIDVPFAAFSIAAVSLVVGTGRADLTASAAFAGFAAATKYTGLLVALEVALIGFVAATLRREKQAFLRQLPKACALLVLISGGWYLRNFLVLGSPIYPPPVTLAHIFHAKAFPVEASQYFEAYIRERGKGCGRGLFAFLALPFNLTFHTASFHGAGGIGLAPLALLPFAIWKQRRDASFLLWLLWVLLFTGIWFVTQQEARFFIPALAVLCAFSVLAIVDLWTRMRLLGRWLLAATLIVSVSYGAITNLNDRRDRIASVFSRHAAEEREHTIPYHDALAFLNSLPDDNAVLILNPWVPCYHIRRPCVSPIGLYHEQPLEEITSPKMALEQLNRIPVSYVLDVVSSQTGFVVAPTDARLQLIKEWPDARLYTVANQVRR